MSALACTTHVAIVRSSKLRPAAMAPISRPPVTGSGGLILWDHERRVSSAVIDLRRTRHWPGADVETCSRLQPWP